PAPARRHAAVPPAHAALPRRRAGRRPGGPRQRLADPVGRPVGGHRRRLRGRWPHGRGAPARGRRQRPPAARARPGRRAMSRPTFHWFLPMRDDTRRYGGDPAPRRADRGYLGEVARAAERGGFESMLVATAHDTADTWLMAAAAAQATSRIRFIVAFRAGYSLPTLAAQQVGT